MSTPQNLADQLKSNMFEILVGKFKVKGICMVMQALLSLYSYSATSGIIVDIGQRMEILPIFDGVLTFVFRFFFLKDILILLNKMEM